MACKNLEKCPFYNDKMDINKGIGKLYKMNYCEKDPTQCARFQVSSKLGKELVPQNLYPNMHERAKQILRENGVE